MPISCSAEARCPALDLLLAERSIPKLNEAYPDRLPALRTSALPPVLTSNPQAKHRTPCAGNELHDELDRISIHMESL